MPPHPMEQNPDIEVAYWRNRVACLELLICDLLAKNQHMRIALGPAPQTPMQEPAEGISKGLHTCGWIGSTGESSIDLS